MSSVAATFRAAWLSLLVLLLGLMPFIHGHLGQPVQSGWHIHALSTLAEVRASPAFEGLACVEPNHRHGVSAAVALHAPEPSDVELTAGIAQSRQTQLRSSGVPAPVPAAAALPAWAQAPARAAPAPVWPAVRSAVARTRHALPPPAQAPPSIRV